MKAVSAVNRGVSGWLFNAGWGMLLLLAFAAFLITAGHSEREANPSVASFGVSGTSALGDLLRLRGYEVVVDNHDAPKLKQGDVAIAFTLEDGEPQVTSVSPIKGPETSGLPTAEDPNVTTAQHVQDQIKNGVVAMWLPLESNFEQSSIAAEMPTQYARVDGKERLLSGSALQSQDPDDSAVALASANGESFVTANKIEKGYEIEYENGIGLTNRFIAVGDNAEFFLETLKTYAPGAKRIVFTEGTFGQVNRAGLLETIGPWAEGAWYQFLFLAFVIVWTLNRRFGLPRMVRRKQSGGREFVDAFTDTMMRAHATTMILEDSLVQADVRLRKILKLRRDASIANRDSLLPAALLTTLKEVRAASTMKNVRPDDAMRLVVKLERQIDELQKQRMATSTPVATLS